MVANLAWADVPTDEEIRGERARQAYWLRMARLTDPRQPTLSQVAQAAGLKPGSGSVVSLWERDVNREGPKRSQIIRLAAFYRLPLGLFIAPLATDADRLQAFRDHADDQRWVSRYFEALDVVQGMEDRTVTAALDAIELARADSQERVGELHPLVELPRAQRRRKPRA